MHFYCQFIRRFSIICTYNKCTKLYGEFRKIPVIISTCQSQECFIQSHVNLSNYATIKLHFKNWHLTKK